MTGAADIDGIIEAKEIGRGFKTFVVTCVDPDYNASSLAAVADKRLKKLLTKTDVWYDKSNVQQTGKDYIQFNLAFNPLEKRFYEIDKTQVKDSLSNGVVQIAVCSAKKTIVIGIPGDSYAFNLAGAGFAFGKPDHAGPQAATSLVKTILNSTADFESDSVDLVLMAHPDCGLYACNEGSLQGALGKRLSPDRFMNSRYQQSEDAHKHRGFLDLSNAVSDLPKLRVSKAVPRYVPNRTPCISNR